MPVYQIGQGRDLRALLFIGVPRTGTVAIDNTLRKHGWHRYYGIELDAVGPRQRCPAQHFHAEILNSMFNIGVFDDVFMIHRHPYARFISAYNSLFESITWCNVVDIDQFWNGFLVVYKKCQFFSQNFFRPQVEFVLPEARLFPFESGLARVLEVIYKDLGVWRAGQGQPDVKPANVSRDRVGLTVADIEPSRKTIDGLRRFYEKDFEWFGYSDSWADFVEQTRVAGTGSDRAVSVVANGPAPGGGPPAGPEGDTLIHVFLTDTYVGWGELFLDALRHQHGETFNVRMDTRDLDDAMLARLRARYNNLTIHNVNIDWDAAARALGEVPERVPLLKQTVAEGNLGEGRQNPLAHRLKQFFSVDQRYRSLPDILAAAREAGYARVFHFDADVYMRGNLDPFLKTIAESDVAFFLNHYWPREKKLHAWGGVLGFNLKGQSGVFVERWMKEIDSAPRYVQRPIGFGQQTLAAALWECSDLVIGDLAKSGPWPMFSKAYHKDAILWTGTPTFVGDERKKNTGFEWCRADLEARADDTIGP